MRQTFALFLCLLIAGSHAAASMNQVKNSQKIMTDIQDKNSEFYQMLEEGSQYVVDEVLNLLKNLEDAAKADLAKLIKAWKIEKALLTGILVKATKAYDHQVIVCNKLEAEQHALEHAIKVREIEIAKNIAHIDSNTAHIQVLKEQRCKNNLIYVNHVIAHRDAIMLFHVLLKAIDSYKPGSFVQIEQIDQVKETLGAYINHYASENKAEFNQAMSQLSESIAIQSGKVSHKVINAKLAAAGHRIADQKVKNFAANAEYKKVGRKVQRNIEGLKKHIDNKQNQITLRKLSQETVRTLANVKAMLSKVLDNLLVSEKADADKDVQNEAEQNQAFASVKSQLQDENRGLARRNELLARQIAVLKVRLARKIRQVIACRKQEARLLAARKLAQKNLDEATARFNARKAVLIGEIALFHRLYVYYKERVYSVATKADKARVQDYVDNKNFKKTLRHREAAKFNGLNVKKYAAAGAHKEVGSFKGF